MKQSIFKIAFTVLSVILFYGCALEPYDWSQDKPTEIEMIEVSFPSIKNESLQVGSYIKTTGKGLEKVEFILQKFNGTEWEEIEKKQGIESNEEEDYYVCDFNNLTGFTSYIILVNVYSSFSAEPIYSNEFNIKTALDEYSLSTGDALDITDKSVTLVTEFSSEKIKPAKEEIGIVYSENKNDIKSNKSTFIPYTDNSDYLYLTNLSGLKPATTYYYCSCIIIDDQRIYSDNIRSFTLNEIEITQGELIDLGLSVKWMSYNLGAYSITDYGKLYPWGSIYNVESINSNDEYPAFKNISGTGYDAAWNELGTFFRIPTQEEWNELNEKCQKEWITYHERNGYKITGPNGNSIFLPADGWINYAHHTDVDLKGYYRIGTQTTIDDAYSIVFDEKYYHERLSTNPQWAISIRPVYDNTIYCETGTAKEITGSSAILSGLFKCNSDKTISECGIWYGTTGYPHLETGFKIVSSNNSGNISVTINGLKINTTYYYCTYVIVDNMTYFSKPNKFTTLLDSEISTEEEVDLGLSVLWRGYNLGTNSPEEIGKHYSFYHFDNYPTYISGTKYDPTVQELGNTWRSPNRKEITELFEKCLWIKQTYRNIEGWQVIGPNNKSIFLPITSNADEYDYYLSGELFRENRYYNIEVIYLTSTFKIMYNIHEGLNGHIRPVKDK